MLGDVENVQVVSFGWFKTWLNLNPGKMELTRIFRSNCFEEVENAVSSLLKMYVPVAVRVEEYFGVTPGFLVTMEERATSSCGCHKKKYSARADKYLSTKGHSATALGGQGACGNPPKARCSW